MVLDPEAVVTVVLLGLELLEKRKRGDRVVCPTHPRHFHSPRSRAMAFLEPFIDGWQALAAAKQFPFTDKHRHFPAHRRQAERRFRAVLAFV